MKKLVLLLVLCCSLFVVNAQNDQKTENNVSMHRYYNNHGMGASSLDTLVNKMNLMRMHNLVHINQEKQKTWTKILTLSAGVLVCGELYYWLEPDPEYYKGDQYTSGYRNYKSLNNKADRQQTKLYIARGVKILGVAGIVFSTIKILHFNKRIQVYCSPSDVKISFSLSNNKKSNRKYYNR